jgi:hypothetical protein
MDSLSVEEWSVYISGVSSRLRVDLFSDDFVDTCDNRLTLTSKKMTIVSALARRPVGRSDPGRPQEGVDRSWPV